MTHLDHSTLKACIDACTQCHNVCQETIRHCLLQGEKHVAPEHIGLLIACSEICQTSANTMLLGVHEHRHTCRACAEICESCSHSCSALAGSDDAMKACADICERCAESCRRMAA